MKYSVIIPVLNEEKSLPELLTAIIDIMRDYDHEIIVVDDGSDDGSVTVVSSFKDVKLLRHNVCKGVGAARTTGVKFAQGEKIIFIDADMTYDVNDIPLLISESDDCDMVVGARTEEMGSYKVLRRAVKDLFRLLAGLLTKTNIPDLNSGLRVLDRKKTKECLYLLPMGHSWVSTITLAFLSIGYSVKFIPVSYYARRGNSTFNLISDTYAMFLTIVKTVVYFYPLRVIMPFSIGFFSVGALFLLRDLISKNIADTTILFFVFAVITFVFALLAEQLACLRRELNQFIFSEK